MDHNAIAREREMRFRQDLEDRLVRIENKLDTLVEAMNKSNNKRTKQE